MTNVYLVIGFAAVIALILTLLPWRRHWAQGCVVSLLVVAATLGVYGKIGGVSGLKKLAHKRKEKHMIQQALAKYKDPEALIAALRRKVVMHPEDPKGWYLLGRLYMANNQLEQARKSFAWAISLEPQRNDPKVLLGYVETDLKITRHLDSTSKGYLHKVLEQIPQHPMALTFLAMGEFRSGHYEQAITYWKQLLPQLDPDSDDAKMIISAINRARSKIKTKAS